MEVRSTYRLQLHAGFTFADAESVVPYLRDLGVSHLYCSPYLQATAGSTHGYDVIDHGQLNEELGGEAGHARLTARLAAQGMGQVLDIVPNHMALAGRANPWWWDVLENGPASRYASYFDIDWDPPERKLVATVLVPVLGDHYGRVLERGELQVVREGGSFVVRYFEHEAPLSPRSLDDLVASAARRCGSDELAFLARALGRLPHSMETESDAVDERHRDKEVLRARLAELCAGRPEVAEAVDAEVAAVNADPDALDALLERQNFRLAFWRTAGAELDYRRFFDINTLAALRTEDPRVFADTHRLVLRLVHEGAVQGLRIDHVDGLRDPEGYLARLRSQVPDAWLVVEKILEHGERLPEAWPTDGTTGYDFLARASGLFVDQAAEDVMTAAYVRFTGDDRPWDETVRVAKLEVMERVLAADVERLTALLALVCESHRRYRDYTRTEQRDAIQEVIAAFPVYRTYVHPGREVSDADRSVVEGAVARATERRPDIDPDLFDFLQRVLLLEEDGRLEHELGARFQQVTAPVMAKGVEDTAFYRWLRLVVLNEVGGDPSVFGTSVTDFHRGGEEAAERWPRAMLSLSTHDTKRSADVRARLALLSEIPTAWEEAVWRWAHLNERHRTDGLPDRGAEYLLYQTMVGAWPLTVERAGQYMEKATREAKVHTSWTDPVPAYDEALQRFVAAVVKDGEMVADLEAFLAEHGLVKAGRVNSLAQVALLLTWPGVPDVYQGAELWDLSLVDPDNRRSVDYERRRSLLSHVADGGPEDALARDDEGAPKLWLLHRLLGLRAAHPDVFAGGYTPLRVTGPAAGHAVAYRRGDDLAVLVPRLVLGLSAAGGWRDTTIELPVGRWLSPLTGDEVDGGGAPVSVADLTARFPVAVLCRQPRR